jgi:heat shock protein 4
MPKADLPETTPIRVVFVDLGETSTTCTAVEFISSKMTVVATTCDRHLGGREFDQVLTQHFTKFAQSKGLDVTRNARAMFRLGAACNKMKLVLSANSEAVTVVECIMEDRDLPLRVTRFVQV